MWTLTENMRKLIFLMGTKTTSCKANSSTARESSCDVKAGIFLLMLVTSLESSYTRHQRTKQAHLWFLNALESPFHHTNVNLITERISSKKDNQINVVSVLAKPKHTPQEKCGHNLVSVTHKALDHHLHRQKWVSAYITFSSLLTYKGDFLCWSLELL
jgi:hypothetical protein